MAYVKVTPEMAAQALRDVDWRRIDAMSDEDIARQVVENPDAGPVLDGPELVGAMAKTIRKRLGLSQAEFARRYRIPLGTLRDWEQGRKQPDATAFAYLRVIAHAPEMVEQALQPLAAA